MAPGLNADLADLAGLDWHAPWWAPLHRVAHPVVQALQQGATVAQALCGSGAAPVRFVPQADLPAGRAYEQFIFETGTVPTRNNLHDCFNGLVWHRFPRTKQRLNYLQAEAIAAQGVGPVRGPLRDALTLLDENGAVLIAPAPLWEALQTRQWRRLFVDLRPLWQQARLVVLGHALLEKLVHPRKPTTAHVLKARAATDLIAFEGQELDQRLDEWLAATLQPGPLTAKPFDPLPVLGIPGWCDGNRDVSFYDDPLVFRSPAR